MASQSVENEKVLGEYEDENGTDFDSSNPDVPKNGRFDEKIKTASERGGQEVKEKDILSAGYPSSAADSEAGQRLDYGGDNEEDKTTRPGDKDVDDEVRSIIDHVQETRLDEAEEPDSSTAIVSGSAYGVGQVSSSTQSSNLTGQGHEDVTVEGKITAASSPQQQHKAAKPPKASAQESDGPSSPHSTRATNLSPGIHRNSLPPEPEPETRFNFNLFLEQLRHRTADPVARYLRSFLTEFGKKQWTVQEQVQIISDFLTFISGKMAQCEVWRDSSESEFDNAREGMEKLVMNRLYAQTFSPELPHPNPPTSENRGRRRPMQKRAQNGRQGQHQEDVERDHVLSEKMQIFGWVEEQHLDIHPVKPEGKRFLNLAQQELLKINNYRAPRDKVICILNACKVIFGLLRSSKSSDTSADSFMPLLIYTVLRSKPQHMVSNIQYIFRFRNQDKLGGETGYYLSSLMGAVQFVETLDRTALTITDSEFEQRVEASVAAIAEKRPGPEPKQAGEGSSKHVDTRLNTGTAAGSGPAQSPSRRNGTDEDGDAGPVQGILRNIQRPLTNLGRMFSDEPNELEVATPPAIRSSSERPPDVSRPLARNEARAQSRPSSNIRNDSRRRPGADVDVDNIVETLSSMFPSLDKEVISDIVIAKQARVGAAVDACLSLTS